MVWAGASTCTSAQGNRLAIASFWTFCTYPLLLFLLPRHLQPPCRPLQRITATCRDHTNSSDIFPAGRTDYGFSTGWRWR